MIMWHYCSVDGGLWWRRAWSRDNILNAESRCWWTDMCGSWNSESASIRVRKFATATWLGVCLSVWLSVTRRYCITTAKPILNSFRPSGSHVILVSSDPCVDTQFQANPFSGGVKYTGWKKWQFSTEIAVYLGNGVRQAVVTMER